MRRILTLLMVCTLSLSGLVLGGCEEEAPTPGPAGPVETPERGPVQ